MFERISNKRLVNHVSGIGCELSTASGQVNFESRSRPYYLDCPVPRFSTGACSLMGAILKALQCNSSWILWPRSGSWDGHWFPEESSVIVPLYRGLGIQLDWHGAIEIASVERSAVLSLMYITSAFAHGVDHDLFVFPDAGNKYVLVTHDDNVLIASKSSSELETLKLALEDQGFEARLG